MTAIQENQTLAFGSARLYGTDTNGNVLQYPELNDIQIDIKVELKEAFGEGNYAFAVVDSHRTIDITAKHYLLDEQGLADSLGGTLSANTITGWAYDEAGVVDPSAHTYALAQTSPLAIESVVGFPTVGGVQVPVYYVVTSGSPGSALGQAIAVTATYQNSQYPLSMVCLRRDRSRVDSSTHLTAWQFLQVRDGGIKAPYKEGDYTIYERMFKAYANPFGQVLNIQMFNA